MVATLGGHIKDFRARVDEAVRLNATTTLSKVDAPFDTSSDAAGLSSRANVGCSDLRLFFRGLRMGAVETVRCSRTLSRVGSARPKNLDLAH